MASFTSPIKIEVLTQLLRLFMAGSLPISPDSSGITTLPHSLSSSHSGLSSVPWIHHAFSQPQGLWTCYSIWLRCSLQPLTSLMSQHIFPSSERSHSLSPEAILYSKHPVPFIHSTYILIHPLNKYLLGNKYGFLAGSDGKKTSACNAGDWGLIPGLGRSPGERNGNTLQYSWLENSMDRGAWQATAHGVKKRGWVTNTFTFMCQVLF